MCHFYYYTCPKPPGCGRPYFVPDKCPEWHLREASEDCPNFTPHHPPPKLCSNCAPPPYDPARNGGSASTKRPRTAVEGGENARAPREERPRSSTPTRKLPQQPQPPYGQPGQYTRPTPITQSGMSGQAIPQNQPALYGQAQPATQTAYGGAAMYAGYGNPNPGVPLATPPTFPLPSSGQLAPLQRSFTDPRPIEPPAFASGQQSSSTHLVTAGQGAAASGSQRPAQPPQSAQPPPPGPAQNPSTVYPKAQIDQFLETSQLLGATFVRADGSLHYPTGQLSNRYIWIVNNRFQPPSFWRIGRIKGGDPEEEARRHFCTRVAPYEPSVLPYETREQYIERQRLFCGGVPQNVANEAYTLWLQNPVNRGLMKRSGEGDEARQNLPAQPRKRYK